MKKKKTRQEIMMERFKNNDTETTYEAQKRKEPKDFEDPHVRF